MGQAGALVLLLWQALLLTDWTVPFQKAAELSVRWRPPHELAAKERAWSEYGEFRDFVLFQGPGKDLPWLYPACAVLLLLIVRAARTPAALQAPWAGPSRSTAWRPSSRAARRCSASGP